MHIIAQAAAALGVTISEFIAICGTTAAAATLSRAIVNGDAEGAWKSLKSIGNAAVQSLGKGLDAVFGSHATGKGPRPTIQEGEAAKRQAPSDNTRVVPRYVPPVGPLPIMEERTPGDGAIPEDHPNHPDFPKPKPAPNTRTAAAERQAAANAAASRGTAEASGNRSNPEPRNKNDKNKGDNKNDNKPEGKDKKPGWPRRSWDWVKAHPRTSVTLGATAIYPTRELVIKPVANYALPIVGNAVTGIIAGKAPLNIPISVNDSTDLWYYGGIGKVGTPVTVNSQERQSNEAPSDTVKAERSTQEEVENRRNQKNIPTEEEYNAWWE